jgi:hypothetical protein
VRFREFISENSREENKFLFGHCLSFAKGFQETRGGKIRLLCRDGKDLHAYVQTDEGSYDVKGKRGTVDMAHSLVGSHERFYTRDHDGPTNLKPINDKHKTSAKEYIEAI